MRGFGGADWVYGHGGRDVMYGGDGRDGMYSGNGFDRISAGAGKDFVSVIGDNAGNYANCGPGNDTVNEQLGEQGPEDVYENCENVAV
jgi:Ca2+-binding RTX toxin-like protein